MDAIYVCTCFNVKIAQFRPSLNPSEFITIVLSLLGPASLNSVLAIRNGHRPSLDSIFICIYMGTDMHSISLGLVEVAGVYVHMSSYSYVFSLAQNDFCILERQESGCSVNRLQILQAYNAAIAKSAKCLLT